MSALQKQARFDGLVSVLNENALRKAPALKTLLEACAPLKIYRRLPELHYHFFR